MDYDNATNGLREQRLSDAAANLQWVFDVVTKYVALRVSSRYGRISELQVRLYGGWLDERGQATGRADWIYRVVGDMRGRRNGVRVLPQVATTIASCPDDALIGLCRKRAGSREQKMVDTMMTVDLLHFAQERDAILLVMSDDDDMVPGVLAAASYWAKPVWLLRRRKDGAGLNDRVCRKYVAAIDLLEQRMHQ